MVATRAMARGTAPAGVVMSSTATELKAKSLGDAACKLGNYEEAVKHYSDAARKTAGCPLVMSNRSLANFKLGNYTEAVEDAEEAICNFDDPSFKEERHSVEVMEKAYLRKATALVMLGEHSDAIDCYRKALQQLGSKARLVTKALRNILTNSSEAREHVSKVWASYIEDAQSPAILSSRDGKLIKLVPKQERLDKGKMASALLDLPTDFADKLMAGWTTGRGPGRTAIAAARAWGYLHVGENKQALKDAQSAVAFGQTATSACRWPPAFAVLALCHEAVGESSLAVLAIGKACELDSSHAVHLDIQARLVEKLTEEQREVFAKEGVAGLQKWLEDEYERSLPEFKRTRPKWYYYYEYMKKRINAIHEALPEPVMDKLLTMDAEELDLVLKYESAAKEQITELMEVLDNHGASYLESYQPKMLSWEQVQRLQADEASKQERIAYAEIPPEAQQIEATAPKGGNGSELRSAAPDGQGPTIITFGGGKTGASGGCQEEDDIDLDALD